MSTESSTEFRARLSRRSTLAALAGSAGLAAVPAALAAEEAKTYGEDEMLKKASAFFGKGSEGLAKVIEKVFKDQGRPNGYIQGEEVSAALSIGLRYGEGRATLKAGGGGKVFWAGPSIGIDAGANASKVFTLIYNLPKLAALYQRYPGVEGSLYWIGGVGVNYQHLDGITLAPMRLGVGLRTGASVGYLHYRREKSYNPL
jgi:hypothetical protein